jgi:hypothetical protein
MRLDKKDSAVQSLMDNYGLTEDAARGIIDAMTGGLTEFLKERFLGHPVTLASVEAITAACTEFYQTEAYKVIEAARLTPVAGGAP